MASRPHILLYIYGFLNMIVRSVLQTVPDTLNCRISKSNCDIIIIFDICLSDYRNVSTNDHSEMVEHDPPFKLRWNDPDPDPA